MISVEVKYSCEYSIVVLLDSTVSLKIFNKKMDLPVTLSMSQQVIIYLQKGFFDELLTIPDPKKPVIKNEYFLLNERKSIRLLTFMWFELTACAIPKLVEVNSFNKLSRRWEHNRFKIDKFSNFNGCQINFLIQKGMPEFNASGIDHKNKAITECMGYVCTILKDMKNI